MINAAERSLAALAERDNLEIMQRRQHMKARVVLPDESSSGVHDESEQEPGSHEEDNPNIPQTIPIKPPLSRSSQADQSSSSLRPSLRLAYLSSP